MRILITGVAGFIGSHIADAMLEQGHQVSGIDDLSTGRQANVPDGVTMHHGDIRVPRAFPAGQFDVVYHCAASYRDRTDWERDASVNVLGSINVARFAEHAGARIVYFQTSLCYGRPTSAEPIPREHPLNPVGSYAVSKTAGERYLFDSGLPVVSLRLANIYGPRNLSGPVPAFYRNLSEGRPSTVVDTRRDFVYVGDLVDLLGKISLFRGVFHVASGSDVPIVDIYREVARQFLIVDEPAVQRPGPDDMPSILLDASATRTAFGWQPRTSLVTGMEKAVEWYRANGVENVYTHLAVKVA